jgi:glycosyltransferase involved in cell wall biosynthesis
MDVRPAVSVCMPASREPERFARALRSVLHQRHEDLEVVVCDDSCGGLEEAARAPRDPRVRYVANPRRLGFARNHTTALDLAYGAHLAFLHDDDYWTPGYLERTLAAWADDPALGLVCTDMWLEDEQGRRRRRAGRPAPGRHDRWLDLVMSSGQFQPSSTVLRREVWDSGRRAWPDVGVGDLVLWIDAARAGWPMFWIDEPLAIYHGHPGQIIVTDAARAATVTVLSAYRFDEDPVAERARRRRLAGAHVACAGGHLRERRAADARRSLQAARATDRRAKRPRRLVLQGLAAQPWIAPAAAAAWRRARGLA